MATTKVMLGTTVYGVPSGTYDGSSMDWASDAVTAANYYRGHGSLQTVRYQLTGFIGKIYFEATLDETAQDANWFNTIAIGDGSTEITELRSQSIVGNFTWIRVRVENFDAGTINSVTVTY